MAHTATADNYNDRTRQKQDRVRNGTNVSAQKNIYGGFNFGAAFFGWLVSTGVAVIVTSLLAGAGSAIAFNAVDKVTPSGIANAAHTIGLVSGILLIATLAIAYFAGGYVAGRMSRFDGARQGFGVWLMGILITLLLGGAGAIFGAKYNALQQINLPHIPVNEGSFTTGGLIAFIVAIAVTLGSAILGGKVGERYHRKVDQAGVV
jgi:hypothetical protein